MPANSYWFFITIMMNRDYLEKVETLEWKLDINPIKPYWCIFVCFHWRRWWPSSSCDVRFSCTLFFPDNVRTVYAYVHGRQPT